VIRNAKHVTSRGRAGSAARRGNCSFQFFTEYGREQTWATILRNAWQPYSAGAESPAQQCQHEWRQGTPGRQQPSRHGSRDFPDRFAF
jgi:hypothetical protein